MSEILSVLIVEDNHADIDLIQEALQETGTVSFQIESVSRLSEALVRLKNGDNDLVLLDLGLPDSQGLGTFNKLSEAAPHIPVIILTGNNDQEMAVTAVREGAQDYLIKGQLGNGLLIRAVRYAVERKRAEQALQKCNLDLFAIINNLPFLAWLKDSESRFLAVNEPFARSCGLSSVNDLVGKTDLDIWPKHLAEAYRADDLEVMRTRQKKSVEESIADLGVEKWFETYKSPLYDTNGNVTGTTGFSCDITERKLMDDRERLTREVLDLLNRPAGARDTIRDILQLIKKHTRFEAVGLRLKEGADFPYYATNHFPENFILAENRLCAYDENGEIVHDEQGNPVLECMCGNIIRRRTDASLPFFTDGGSFWTNSTTDLLASTSEEDRLSRIRNRCHDEGYESVALIPLRSSDEIIGLLQLNDRRRNRFTLGMIHFFEGLGESIGIALTRKQAKKVLLEKKTMLDNILRSAIDMAVATTDLDFRITYFNPMAEKLFGYSAKQVIDKTVQEIHTNEKAVPDRFIYAIEQVINKGDYCFCWEKKTDTGIRLIESRVAGIISPNGDIVGYSLFSKDVTKRVQMEEALRESENVAKRQAQANDSIAEIGRIIGSTLNIEEVYERFAEKMEEAIPFDRIAVNTVNMTDYTRTVRYVRGGRFSGKRIGEVYPLTGTGIEKVVLAKSSLIINSQNREDIMRKFPAISSVLFEAQSSMIIPLISKDEAIGALAIHSVKTDAYSENDLHFAERVGSQIAGAIANAELYLERKEAEKQLQDTLESLRRAVGATIQVMVSAVETRDPYTAGHQVRSANLARAIAIEMELPPEMIEGLRMAGTIHDIGKLSIPAEILSKPTKLTDIEFALIKEHARQGYEMLKDVESPWPLAEIVRQHHERMDGSGYPRNLKGEEILMEARILHVADVVEAMASHRPYRPSRGIDAALKEIEKNSGIIYDHAVADACLKLFREKAFQL